jgi:hypothetical protein
VASDIFPSMIFAISSKPIFSLKVLKITITLPPEKRKNRLQLSKERALSLQFTLVVAHTAQVLAADRMPVVLS